MEAHAGEENAGTLRAYSTASFAMPRRCLTFPARCSTKSPTGVSSPNTHYADSEVRLSDVLGAIGKPQCAGNHFHRPILETRSEEHTSELQSLRHLVCRL